MAFVIWGDRGLFGVNGGGAFGVPGAGGAGGLRREVMRIGRPSSVDPIRYDGRPVTEDVVNALILFLSSFILILGVMSVALTLGGVDARVGAVRCLDLAWQCRLRLWPAGGAHRDFHRVSPMAPS
jgi:hypothetical protein